MSLIDAFIPLSNVLPTFDSNLTSKQAETCGMCPYKRESNALGTLGKFNYCFISALTPHVAKILGEYGVIDPKHRSLKLIDENETGCITKFALLNSSVESILIENTSPIYRLQIPKEFGAEQVNRKNRICNEIPQNCPKEHIGRPL